MGWLRLGLALHRSIAVLRHRLALRRLGWVLLLVGDLGGERLHIPEIGRSTPGRHFSRAEEWRVVVPDHSKVGAVVLQGHPFGVWVHHRKALAAEEQHTAQVTSGDVDPHEASGVGREDLLEEVNDPWALLGGQKNLAEEQATVAGLVLGAVEVGQDLGGLQVGVAEVDAGLVLLLLLMVLETSKTVKETR